MGALRRDALRLDFNLRLWLALFFALGSLSLLSLQGVAQQPPTAAPSAQSSKLATIPIEMNGNHVLLQGRVNGSAPLWFTLDTGAASSVINMRLARELKLQVVGNSRAQGAGGMAESSRLNGITFSLPGVEIKNLSVMAIALESIEATAGRSMDVIIGAELFHRYVVEVDYASRTLTLYDPQQFVYKGTGESLPLKFFYNHPYVTGRIDMPGMEPIEGDFVIDAGSGFGITFQPGFVKEHKLMEHVTKTIQTKARGVGGEFPLAVGRVESLEIGRFKLDKPVTAFPQTGGFISKEGSVGNIGGLILRRFKVIFDYPHKRMILEPNKSFGDPFDFDMSGLALVSESPQFKTIKINRVMDASPASEVGLKADDVVLEVDGRAAAEYTLHTLREMFKKEGKEYRLKIKRGEETLQVQIKTRRLI
ncbi:MAG: aspartyl protease family protein [Pyrinomonadaceae bacterium]|nr:aspartyl protease family protein [Pyrinomonadaceae bacterium]